MWTFLNGKWVFAPENEGGTGSDPEPEEGDDDADAGSDPEPEEGDDDADAGSDPEPARKETRVQRLANEARRERERAIVLETELRLAREQRNVPLADTGETARIRAEKLALMDPSERKLFEQDETIARLQQGQQLTQIQMADYADKSHYATIAASDTVKGKVYAKHQAWVEKTLTEERKLGRNPNRESLLMLKVGYDAVNTPVKKQTVREKEAAAARVKSAKGAPTSARSDAGTKKSGGDSLESLRARILERERLGATS